MKLKSLLLAGAAALLLTSCNDEENGYHSTFFYPVNQSGVITYADQDIDSTRVISYDDWTLSNTCEWFDVEHNGMKNEISVHVPAGYVSSNRLDLKLQPNATGKTRSCPLQVVSSFNKIGTVMQNVVQLPYINIIYPYIKTTTDANGETAYEFTLEVPAGGLLTNGKLPYIRCVVYDRQATLTSDADWVVPEITEPMLIRTPQDLKLIVAKNTTGAQREAMLTLTSNGISTPIKLVQAKAE